MPAEAGVPKKWPSARRFFAIGLGRLVRLLIVLVPIAVVTRWIGGRADLSCPGNPHTIVRIELAGTTARSQVALTGCSEGSVHTALWFDMVFIVWYVLALTGGILFVAGRWLSKLGGYRLRKLRGASATMIGAVIAAGLLDVIENVALRLGLRGPDGDLGEEGWAAATAATVGWAKFVLVGLVLAYVIVGLVGWLAMPKRDLRDAAPYEPNRDDESGQLGICLSGGGVRAATFGLGVLQVLDRERLVDKARWVSSVSGGSYMAGAWAIARSKVPGTDGSPRPWADDDQGTSPEVSHLRHHLNYLFARDGKVAGAVATLIVGLAINAVSLFVFLWLLARPLGWLVGSWLMTDASDTGVIQYTLERRYWTPVAAWAAVSAVAFLVWVMLRRLASLNLPLTGLRARAVVWGAATGGAFVTALLAFVLILVPLGTSALPRLVGDHAELLRLLQAIAAGGVAATIISVFRKPLGRALPRLGGVLVAVLAAIAATEIAAGAALLNPHDDLTLWLVVLVVFAIWYYAADPDWWSLQPYYRARLREAYATHRPAGDPSTVESLQPGEEPALSELGRMRSTDPAHPDGPELLVCTTMNVSGGTPTRVGVPAYSFTFSPTKVRFHVPGADDGRSDDYAVSTEQYARIFRRWDTPRLTAMTAVGMSGAAVSSAMGRFKYGSTKALLALANVRLGMWMPSPRFVPAGDLPPRPGYPRRRLNYLVKEMFSIYDAEDLYLYITDGGHWENLGLVELLRRRCREVICVDASGSDSTSFGQIAEAITLAAQESGARVELPYEPLRAQVVEGIVARTVPQDCAVGVITYANGESGVLWYVKESLTADAPSRLLSYKEKNDVFPCDPTSNQNFNTEQFECYRLLGQHAARHLLEKQTDVLNALRDGPARNDSLTVGEVLLLGQIRAALDPQGVGPRASPTPEFSGSTSETAKQ